MGAGGWGQLQPALCHIRLFSSCPDLQEEVAGGPPLVPVQPEGGVHRFEGIEDNPQHLASDIATILREL